jgi:peroxiredoxin (alkyl hydroperoxide reductase subunit C)
MNQKKPEGCVSAAAGPIQKSQPAPAPALSPDGGGKEIPMSVMVGKEAPDFEATAFHGGGFTSVKLSSFRGKWVFLCFYPGDFTFV